eukprot:TRINITY_DN6064_c0_g1_i1.p1 TRINITY_DN6064_c0_g1~~TRINITY_DN6064_c0_g1_i1.p1  ORF type:complete len:547 (-),score=48.89 TRINITY_DN6064_c0_g1_i1:90-1730(-)
MSSTSPRSRRGSREIKASAFVCDMKSLMQDLESIRQRVLDLSFRITPSDVQSGMLLSEAYSHYDAQHLACTKLLAELESTSDNISPQDTAALSKQVFEARDKYNVLASTLNLLESRAPATARTVWLRDHINSSVEKRAQSDSSKTASARSKNRRSEGRPFRRTRIDSKETNDEKEVVEKKQERPGSSPTSPRKSGSISRSSSSEAPQPKILRQKSAEHSGSGSSQSGTSSDEMSGKRSLTSTAAVAAAKAQIPTMSINLEKAVEVRDVPNLRPKLLTRQPSMSLESLMNEVLADHQSKIESESQRSAKHSDIGSAERRERSPSKSSKRRSADLTGLRVHSSDRDKDRDRDRDRERERERGHRRNRSGEKERAGGEEEPQGGRHSGERDRESRDRSREKDRESSRSKSNEKDRRDQDKDRNREREKDKDRERDKDRSSRSSRDDAKRSGSSESDSKQQIQMLKDEVADLRAKLMNQDHTIMKLRRELHLYKAHAQLETRILSDDVKALSERLLERASSSASEHEAPQSAGIHAALRELESTVHPVNN